MLYIVVAMLCLLASGSQAAPEEAANKTNDFDSLNLAKCPEGADNAEECIKSMFNTVLQRSRLGVPELNIEPYDPLLINRSSFHYSSGVVKGRISVRNVKLFGLAEHKIEKLRMKVNGDKVKFEMISTIPKVNMNGIYKAEMQVNSLHLKPKGNFNITLFDVENHVVTDGDILSKDGHRYFRFTDIEADPKIRDLTIKANGIFPDPELDEIALNVANNYWRDIYGVILPETRRSWLPVLLRVINQALINVPIDDFLQSSE
ncbi:GH25092 [Drosophila grimshawi]|uniref:GH25092 n=2 Tax=Drosophila grimshawi TaxID=7222 RepID=B4JZC7_DROGR|nr:GH25092 [Drosophila grimshawi]